MYDSLQFPPPTPLASSTKRLGFAIALAACLFGCDVLAGEDGARTLTWATIPSPVPELQMGISADPNGTLYAFPARPGHISDPDLYEHRTKMYVSEDRGETWEGMENRFDIDAFAVLGADTLLAQTGNSFRRSTDGGASWTVVLNGQFYRSVSFSVGLDGQITVVTDRTDTLYRSLDFGATWDRVALPDGNVITEAFSGSTPSTFFRGRGRLYRTADGGATWADVGPGVYDLAHNEAGTLVSVSADGVMASSDAGATWRRVAWDPSRRVVRLRDGFAVLTTGRDVLKLNAAGQVVAAYPSRYDIDGGVVPQTEDFQITADDDGFLYMSVRPQADVSDRVSLASTEPL